MKYEISNGTYQIAEFDKAKEDCAKFISENGNVEMVIATDDDKKVAKKSRTLIRKKKDEIGELRKQLNVAIMGTFNEQAKELERMLDEADASLKAKIADYDDSKKPVEPEKPEAFTILVSSFDKGALDKVREYALSLGCGVN